MTTRLIQCNENAVWAIRTEHIPVQRLLLHLVQIRMIILVEALAFGSIHGKVGFGAHSLSVCCDIAEKVVQSETVGAVGCWEGLPL